MLLHGILFQFPHILKNFTFKTKERVEETATLLILTTAHGLQMLALINFENIYHSSSGIAIKIADLIKTFKPGFFQPELNFP